MIIHCVVHSAFIRIEYHFVKRAEMETMIANGEFFESSEFSSNLYGTR